jgi:hypothetical protein
MAVGDGDSRILQTTHTDCTSLIQHYNHLGYDARGLSTAAAMTDFLANCQLHQKATGDSLIAYDRTGPGVRVSAGICVDLVQTQQWAGTWPDGRPIR